MDDSVSLRVDYSVPTLVTTKKGKKLASGFELKRFVLAHRIGVEDFDGPMFKGDVQKLWEMFRPRFEEKLAADAAGWSVTFKGLSILRHPCDETPKEDDARWV